MAEKIAWTLSVQVTQGPKIADGKTIEVDAYDKVDVTIAAGTNRTVQVQPGGAGQVQLLLVKASEYGTNLTYKVNDPANPSIALDALLLLMGNGAVGLLGAAPTSLIFSNGLANDVSIQVLVGRNATS